MTETDDTRIPFRVVLNQRVSDLAAFGETIDWDCDFRQIEAGKLTAAVLLIAGHQFSTVRIEFNRKFHQRGCPPPGVLTFGFPDRRAGNLRWNGVEAEPGALLNFNDGRLDGVNPGRFGGNTLSFNEGFLQDVAETLGFDLDVATCVKSTCIWNPGDSEHDRLRGDLRVLQRIALNGDGRTRESLIEHFAFGLAASVVRILGTNCDREPREYKPFRTAALKRALVLIDDPQQELISVAVLCKKAGASWATLERAFAEEFGTSPKSYITSRRLSAVRTRLLRAGSSAVVTDIANDCGFWHMGRFAADYRKQFGELPSQTLRSRRNALTSDSRASSSVTRVRTSGSSSTPITSH